MVLVRRWWPVPLFVATSLVVQKGLFENHYHVSGHAAEHVTSATAPFGAPVFLAVLFLATPGAGRQRMVVVTGALWLIGTVAVLVGNVRVIDALIRAGI